MTPQHTIPDYQESHTGAHCILVQCTLQKCISPNHTKQAVTTLMCHRVNKYTTKAPWRLHYHPCTLHNPDMPMRHYCSSIKSARSNHLGLKVTNFLIQTSIIPPLFPDCTLFIQNPQPVSQNDPLSLVSGGNFCPWFPHSRSITYSFLQCSQDRKENEEIFARSGKPVVFAEELRVTQPSRSCLQPTPSLTQQGLCPTLGF